MQMQEPQSAAAGEVQQSKAVVSEHCVELDAKVRK